MPRTEVYQLRLTGKEKARLAATAAARGHESIAAMVRADYELVDASKVAPSPADASPGSKTCVSHSVSEIRRLAMQRHAHLPLGDAERKVRAELGPN